MTQEFHGQKNRDDHALAIGRIVIAWNEYQELLGEIFGTFFGSENFARSMAAWHALDNDRAQRAMLKAVSELKLKHDKKARDEVVWLINQTDQLISDQRNIGIHAPLMSFTDDKGVHMILPLSHLGNRKAKRLEGANILQDYGHYEGQIRTMTDYAMAIRFAVSPQGRRSEVDWPDRPKLTSRPKA